VIAVLATAPNVGSEEAAPAAGLFGSIVDAAE
jgi:hypothetical protein